ncbi:MAG TPA: DUF2059 domain-containing protein [Woeseiaceae bacterium]|nr:DUF2059 domain-containing protein [Woeseiaceae bacterium]
MKYVIALISLVLASASYTQVADEEYNHLVDEVLELTGALKIGQQFSAAIVEQMVGALRATNSDLPDEAYSLIEEEVNTTIADSMESGSFQRLMYPIYAEHLSRADLEAMVSFYKSDAGRRIAEAMPIMAQQGMLAGQAWGESLGPEIGTRVLQRLAEEGYELP